MGLSVPHLAILLIVGLVIVAVVTAAIGLLVTLVGRRKTPKRETATPLERVERLADLRDRALIDPDEFEKLKGDVVSA